jgi:hypothetical protein
MRATAIDVVMGLGCNRYSQPTYITARPSISRLFSSTDPPYCYFGVKQPDHQRAQGEYSWSDLVIMRLSSFL